LRLVSDQATAPRTAREVLCTLLDWSDRDPVDQFERRRNDWIKKRQGVGNPFVDRPEFAHVIWGKSCP
jgi:endonuclease I